MTSYSGLNRAELESGMSYEECIAERNIITQAYNKATLEGIEEEMRHHWPVHSTGDPHSANSIYIGEQVT